MGSCDEVYIPYTGIETDDSMGRIQSFYDRNGSSVCGIFSSAASSFGWSRPKSTILPLKNSQSALLCHAPPSRWDDEDDLGTTCCSNLSIRRQMLGAICLLCLGQCLQASCWFYFGSVMLGYPAKFATCYTLGNFVMMCASLFFSGPTQQMKKIMLKQRGSTLALFMSTMLLTFVTVYSRPFAGRSFLLILFVVVLVLHRVIDPVVLSVDEHHRHEHFGILMPGPRVVLIKVCRIRERSFNHACQQRPGVLERVAWHAERRVLAQHCARTPFKLSMMSWQPDLV